MAGLLYDSNNVVVGHAVLWLSPWTLAGPNATLPADTVPIFTPASWPDPWRSVGATNEGFKVNVETSTTVVTIEEQTTPTAERIEGKNMNIEAALAEDTLETIKTSWGGGTIVTAAAASGVPGTKKMSLTDDLTFYVAALETRNQYGLARRIFIPKVSASGSGETSFRRSADKRMYPLRITAVCPPSQIQIVDIVAAALA